MPTIEQLREKIDHLDAAIIKKLAQRQKLSKKIGQLKLKQKMQIKDITREKQMLLHYEKLSAPYQMNPIFIRNLFKQIIDYSRNVQQSSKACALKVPKEG